jgi:hypothetical protein
MSRSYTESSRTLVAARGHDVAVKVLALAALAACTPLYERGMFAGAVAASSCLDVAIAGEWPTAASGPVLAVSLGNRCEHALHVDLRELHVATPAGGLLALYDPDHEIVPTTMVARSHGRVELEYHPRTRVESLARLEVELGALVAGEPATHARVAVDVPASPALGDDEVVR